MTSSLLCGGLLSHKRRCSVNRRSVGESCRPFPASHAGDGHHACEWRVTPHAVSETAAGDVLFIHRACLRLFCRGRRLSRRGRYQTFVGGSKSPILAWGPRPPRGEGRGGTIKKGDGRTRG